MTREQRRAARSLTVDFARATAEDIAFLRSFGLIPQEATPASAQSERAAILCIVMRHRDRAVGKGDEITAEALNALGAEIAFRNEATA